MKKVIFICTGNTCRSPMAMEIFDLCLAEGYPELKEKIEVRSAGLFAFPDEPASPEAVAVMKELGVDLSMHRTTAADTKLLKEADYIFTMTAGHREQIKRRFGIEGNVFTLYGYVGDEQDVQDPFGRGEKRYRECRDEIRHLIRLILPKLSTEIILNEKGERNRQNNVEN